MQGGGGREGFLQEEQRRESREGTLRGKEKEHRQEQHVQKRAEERTLGLSALISPIHFLKYIT